MPHTISQQVVKQLCTTFTRDVGKFTSKIPNELRWTEWMPFVNIAWNRCCFDVIPNCVGTFTKVIFLMNREVITSEKYTGVNINNRLQQNEYGEIQIKKRSYLCLCPSSVCGCFARYTITYIYLCVCVVILLQFLISHNFTIRSYFYLFINC